jgi:hypothetical protein
LRAAEQGGPRMFGNITIRDVTDKSLER